MTLTDTGSGTFTQTVNVNAPFLIRPGTWYWQARYRDHTVPGPGYRVTPMRTIIVKPLPAPEPFAPANLQTVPYGGSIDLALQDQPLLPLINPLSYISISRSPAVDSDGDFTDELVKLLAMPGYQGDPDRYWTSFGSTFQPGTYYWKGQRHDPESGDPDYYVSSAAMRSFIVKPEPTGGRAAPNTSLTKTPRKRSSKTTVGFAFRSSQPGAKFQCQFTRGWTSCRSPLTVRHVAPGRYIFRVRAVKNGKVDKTPASCRFRVTKGRHASGPSVLRRIR